MRTIPLIVIENDAAIKTKLFESFRYLGDPTNLVHLYNELGADELFFAIRDLEFPSDRLLTRLAGIAMIPSAICAPFKTLEHVSNVFEKGFDKAFFKSSFFDDCNLIVKSIETFGASSIGIVLDLKLIGVDLFVDTGRSCGKLKLADMKSIIRKINRLGVGEVLIQRIDRDGMKNGLDIKTAEAFFTAIDAPCILAGGLSASEELKDIFEGGVISAVASGTLFSVTGRYDAPLVSYQNFMSPFEES